MRTAELDVVDGPRLETRAEMLTLGIRETVPFRTMLLNRDRMLAELLDWLCSEDISTPGPFFLRLFDVDMAGQMDIEVGVVATSDRVDDRVRQGSIPPGNYALLSYRAKSITANRRLLDWVRDEHLELDSTTTSRGEVFASRCEIYRTDPRLDKRRSQWVVELAFLTRG